jgi:riboflavin kinase / FMN adenylyltransferase
VNVLDPGWDVPPASGVAIGVFDGVHVGHSTVLRRLVERADSAGLATGVLTFDPHPVQILAPDRAPLLLTSFDRRVELIRDLGVDWVGTLDLRQIRMMSPESFVAEVVAGRANGRLVSVGDDFRFGHDRRGDVAMLAREGGRYGLEVVPVHLVGDGKATISSSRIRALIAAGAVEEAARLLGRPHRLEGEVLRGDARGRDLGYPTANLALPAGLIVPADGIYAVRVGGAVVADGVASLGVRPTFGIGGTRLLEVNIFDFEDDLYGRRLEVDFIQRLRGEERFDSVDDLVTQMDRDAAAARRILKAASGSFPSSQ